MIIHNALPFLIAIFGVGGGIYILQRSKWLATDRTLHINFIAMGILDIYIGIIYFLVLLGVISSVPTSELSLFMRPANLLVVTIPLFIYWRLGL